MEIPDEVIDAVVEVQLSLLTLPGVNGVGAGMREVDGEVFDELAIRILVDDASLLDPGIPDEIAGVAVCVVERRYEPLALPDLRRYSELRGGIHINHPDRVDHGTLGAIVRDTSAIASGDLLGLSCFHVVGDRGPGFPHSVFQPDHGPVPITDRSDSIGSVSRAAFPDGLIVIRGIPIRVGNVDAAVFDLADGLGQPSLASVRSVSRSIMGNEVQDPNLADAITATARANKTLTRVRKRGAMTGVTHGMVIAPYMSHRWSTLDALGQDRYMLGSIEILVDRTATPSGVFVRSGDSGSVVLLRNESTAVGLLWGGSVNGNTGLMTDISVVESKLQISVLG
jgi:hypothetical protein